MDMDESLEEFLKQFFMHYSICETAQQLLREMLTKNMIHSVYLLSRASPNALIQSGVPAAFVDECIRSGVFLSEEKDEDKVALASSFAQTGPIVQSTNTWSAIGSVPARTSLNAPYRRDMPTCHRAENWSVDEMMILLDAKKVEDGISVANRLGKKMRPARETWKAISDRIVRKNVRKTPHQCWIKWVKLNKSFRKIYRYEKSLSSSQESFWNLSTKVRKEKSMPTSFHHEVYNAMVEKFGEVKELRQRGHSIELSVAGDEHFTGAEAVRLLHEAQDDLSISSQHLTADLPHSKHQHETKGEEMEITRQLIMQYEDMENRKLQVERQRLISEEKRNMSLCDSISEMANALRSIADVLRPKS